jgi:fatty acid desaturase
MRLALPVKALLRFNNTLFGRMLIGPAISTWALVKGDIAAMRKGDRRVWLAWGLHAVGLAMLWVWLEWVGAMPGWAYVLAAYLGWSLLKIRTYLEHRAHEAARARTVVIESRGPLSLLFLNNNFHVVHHMHPAVPWYKLPGLYFGNREHYLRRNESYRYASYVEIFREFLFRAKDPVPHPVWPVEKGGALDQPAELRGGAGIVEERHAGLIVARH